MSEEDAEKSVKQSIADICKTLEDLKGQFDGDEFFAGDKFTRVVVAFNNVSIRTEAQGVIFANPVNGGRGRS